MKIRFVSSNELAVALIDYRFSATKWYGLYYSWPREIWVNRELDLFHLIETLFHEIGHWFLDLVGLRRYDLYYEIVAHFFKLTESPNNKSRSLSAYYSEIKKPH